MQPGLDSGLWSPRRRRIRRPSDAEIQALGVGCGVGFGPYVPSGGVAPFTPASLSPFAWWRADLGVTLVSGRVESWTDQQNGHLLVQTTAANQPVVDAATLGGQASLYFDNTTLQNLVSNEASSVWTFLHDGTGCDVFLVLRVGAPAPADTVPLATATIAGGTSLGSLMLVENAIYYFEAGNGAASVVASPGTGAASAPSATNLLIESAYKTGQATKDDLDYIDSVNKDGANNTAVPSTAAPGSSLTLGSLGGGAQRFFGYLAEVVILKRLATPAERASMQTYVHNRCGI